MKKIIYRSESFQVEQLPNGDCIIFNRAKKIHVKKGIKTKIFNPFDAMMYVLRKETL